MTRIHTLLVTLALALLAQPTNAEGTRLLRHPSIDEHHIVFAYANDIWVVDRDGGDARRLTAFAGSESEPHLSPDGTQVAFTGEYDGNVDVYVVPLAGGEPRRLTWHPGADLVRGWTPDGNEVVFMSGRTGAPIPVGRFWTVGLEGGAPEAMPMPRAFNGKISSDGRRVVYQQIQPWDIEWRNYRGGQARPIWLLDLDTLALTVLPWEGSNDTDPVWLGDDIYFLSDRDYCANVYRYDADRNAVTQVTRYTEFDVKHLEAGGGSLVYEHGGYIHRLDPATGDAKAVAIEVRGDLPWTRPHWASVGDSIREAAISPTGKRAVVEARGEIFTVPAEKGDVRNLTNSPAAADRSPVWSPDGKHIAWFSDDTGEYRLMIGTQDGREPPRAIDLHGPTFYFTPAWSPDSKKILFTDEGLNLRWVDVETGAQTLVDTDGFAHPQRTMNPVWSPDSRWIAWAKRLDTQLHAVMLYSLEDGSIHQLTDGLSDCVSPAFDRGGKYIYFLASTDFALNTGWLDMSSYERPVRRAIYFAVLAADEPSPLLPESDEEPVEDEPAEGEADEDAESDSEPGEGAEASESDETPAEGESGAGDEAGAEEDEPIRIDLEGIDQRILALPVPPGNYAALATAGEGVVLYAEAPENGPGFQLHRWDMGERETKPMLSGVMSFVVSADGQKMLYRYGGGWGIVATAAPTTPGQGRLDTNLRARINPRAEWRQIFREAWRFQRDFFYVENVHGADWAEVYERYAPWLEHVAHRSDLTHLLDILGGETAIGHSFTGGGDTPDVDSVPIGLLGADLEIDSGRYRIARIYTGENWNPGLRAPLSGPGIDVAEGDYLLAVNGVELTAADNPYRLFEHTAGRQIVLRVNDAPTDEGARTVTVVPVANEMALRQRAWVEGNRRRVDELSGGRLAYVWLPNTGFGGYTNFNRYYFAQQDRLGAIIDERFNGGGSAADYMVDIMSRKLQGFFNNPVGEKKPFTNPGAGIWGPKVMVINESAGSGGDLLPWMFRNMEIGPLVGTRTWGGLVGIWDVPPLVDGGFITAPRGGFYTMEGEWAVENEGVAPDIEVIQTPAEVAAGRDPQLEAAVRECLRLLEEGDWPRIVPQPPDPVRARRP